MASKRTINVRNFKFTTEGLQLLADVGFTVKHDGETYAKGEAGHAYKVTFDLLMNQAEAVHHVINTAVINLQNKLIRPMAAKDAKSAYEGKVLKMKDIYPGRGTVVKKEMSLAEIAEKAKTDPAYRAELLKALGA